MLTCVFCDLELPDETPYTYGTPMCEACADLFGFDVGEQLVLIKPDAEDDD